MCVYACVCLCLYVCICACGYDFHSRLHLEFYADLSADGLALKETFADLTCVAHLIQAGILSCHWPSIASSRHLILLLQTEECHT